MNKSIKKQIIKGIVNNIQQFQCTNGSMVFIISTPMDVEKCFMDYYELEFDKIWQDPKVKDDMWFKWSMKQLLKLDRLGKAYLYRMKEKIISSEKLTPTQIFNFMNGLISYQTIVLVFDTTFFQ